MSAPVFSENSLCLMSFLVMLMPLFSFSSIISGGTRHGILAIFNIGASFIISILIFLTVWNNPEVHRQAVWFSIGGTEFTAGILLNNLSVLMMVLVTGIATLVHIYSLSYMKGDPRIGRYWAYLGLFCFSMLGLVITDSLLLIYMFWELVGFSSYLLIGFWFTRDSASRAAKKAFIMNRIGDIGFLCGLMIIYSQFRTFDIVRLFGEDGLVGRSLVEGAVWTGSVGQMPEIALTMAGIAFFAGAVAKSAQFPLHTWLADAMEGPTSVSSLIHAATMVAAGVFLLGRIYPLFDPLVLNIIAVTGTFTALMAASIALTQNDIKRILAYSTISQLGFMIAGMGFGTYGESIFHLSTHAFFKCLLFLAAGAVIHQLHHYKEEHKMEFDHQDIRLMGGLKKQMPVTFVTMLIAAISLAGLPLSSGYLSKEALLIGSFEWAGAKTGLYRIIPYILILTSWLTVFYIFRLIFKVFLGKPRHEGLHEAAPAMSRVLIVLAFFGIFAVFSAHPFSFEDSWILKGFSRSAPHSAGNLHMILPVVLNGVSLILICFAYLVYVKRDGKFFPAGGFVYRFSNRAWYFDEIYDFLFVRPVAGLAFISYMVDRLIVDRLVSITGNLVRVLSLISDWLDRNIIDGLVNTTGDIAKQTGHFARRFQSGRVQHYLITMLAIVITFFILTYFI